jgi:predicted permease
MLPLPIRHAWRSLRRTPAFTVTAVLTLTIGIGASVAMFEIVDGILLKPLAYGHSERLVGVWNDMPPVNLHKAQQTLGTYFTFKRLARTIESVGVYQESSVNAAGVGGAEPQRLTSALVTASMVSTLDVSPLLGRNFSEAEDSPKGPDVVMISEGLWRTWFGADPNILNRTMDVGGRPRQIIGVMPARFRFPTARTQIWQPLQLDPASSFTDGFNYNAIARLRPGVTIDQANRDLVSVLPRMVEMFPNMAPNVPTAMLLEQAKPRPYVVPIRDDVTGGIARTLWVVAAAAALVLLVACANVANLILVRADARQRELAVREALGAGRSRVLGHFLTESALVSAIAAAAGLAVAWASVRALVIAGPADIPRLAELRLDFATIVFTIVLAAVVASICSIIPALRIGRAHLQVALREGGRSGTAGKAQQRLRGTMVALQIALALVVLAGSGLLLRTFQRLHAVRPGFDATNVATFWMSLPTRRYPGDTAVVRFYDQLVGRVNELPGVRIAGVSSRLPLNSDGMNLNPFYVEGDEASNTKIPPLQIYTTVDSGYFHAMRIPLLTGRGFTRLGIQRPNEAIITQRTAEQFWKDPTGRAAVGKRFRSLPGGAWFTIIGVAGNVRDTALAAEPTQGVYFPSAISADSLQGKVQRTMALVVRTNGDPASITASVQRVIHEMDPTLPTFHVRTMDDVLRSSTAQLWFTIVVLGAAAFVTLMLGAIGLYGVMAYLVSLRTRELGVRIALGAQPREVATMITGQGLMLTAAGIGLGLVLFALVARFIRSFLFGVAPSDPLTLAGASLTLVGIAALASWIPARRAAHVDPADALRAE